MHKQIIFMAVFLLAGCTAGEELQNMKQAKADYQECLAENPQNPKACKKEKERYEDAGQTYDSMAPP